MMLSHGKCSRQHGDRAMHDAGIARIIEIVGMPRRSVYQGSAHGLQADACSQQVGIAVSVSLLRVFHCGPGQRGLLASNYYPDRIKYATPGFFDNGGGYLVQVQFTDETRQSIDY
jgi:hypothetical protein